MKKFVHLHNHTHYSLLDGLTKIDELIQTAKDDGAPAVAITDHGVMYGVVEFYQKCLKAGIKPIIGVEAYLAPKSRHQKNTKSDERNYHLLLLARNNEGYHNLIKLTSIAHLEGYYYKPRIDWAVLSRYSRGLIAATACVQGEIPRLILADKIDKARRRIREYQKLFGADNFYLEIQNHPDLRPQKKVNEVLIELAQELGAPLLATNDIHYLRPDDYDVQDVLLCLQTKKKKEDNDRMKMEGQDYYYKPARQMWQELGDWPEALENTLRVADKCNVQLELGQVQLPYFPVPAGQDGNSYLRQLCLAGVKKRYGAGYQLSKEQAERLEYELAVIKKMGWPSYFLIVADFINWAKSNGIVVGPGRGSAAGSYVCYLTGITELDPLKYDLLFERFLNPERVSMPDIDTDFSDVRREEVIRYVEEKYGHDHVAQIITFGTMAARAAVRDVGRVLGYPYDFCDKLAKTIPMFTKLDQALKTVPELKEFYQSDPKAKQIIDYARRLEGVARHASTHACGVLITKNPLTDYVPLQYASSSDRTIVSQYSLHPIEDLGLLKMDFLGLKNLTIIESAIKIIKSTRGLKLKIDEISLADKKTYQLFQRGETTGVFQFESSGMKRYLKELKPSNFEDIIAMVALYRPGPMEWIPDYIAGKHGRKKVTYLHAKLEPILAKTYGVAIYQEQIMQIARDLAGFSMSEADVLRKAVGKKIPELLAKQKEKFIDGCVKNSIPLKLAQTIFSFIEPFAGYGFNRSHAACYALIAYQTAYLKAHWPTEFMAALLIADQGNTDRIAVEIEECRHMGIKVLPPDINQSYDYFTVVTSGTAVNKQAGANEAVNTIRFGLKAIKNVGDHIAEVIIAERKAGGPFLSLADFLKRITDKDLNKKSLESLIKSGCFDQFGERGELLANLDLFLKFNKQAAQAQASAQVSLFADVPAANFQDDLRLAPAPAASRQKKLAWERELLGLYITEHPFADYKKQLADLIIPLSNLSQFLSQDSVVVSGIVTAIKKIITKANESMVFVKIEDGLSNTELLVFPRLYKQTAANWQEGRAVICQGKVSDKDNELKILCNKVEFLDIKTLPQQINYLKKKFAAANGRNGYYNNFAGGGENFSSNQNSQPQPANPQFSDRQVGSQIVLKISQPLTPKLLTKLKAVLGRHRGAAKVLFSIGQGQACRLVETECLVAPTEALWQELKNNFGNAVELLDSWLKM